MGRTDLRGWPRYLGTFENKAERGRSKGAHYSTDLPPVTQRLMPGAGKDMAERAESGQKKAGRTPAPADYTSRVPCKPRDALEQEPAFSRLGEARLLIWAWCC